MAGQTLDVIVAGHLCLDMIPEFETQRPAAQIGDILTPGALIKMGGIAFSTGGTVSNVGIAMKMFGCRVGFMARVGDDALGRIIIEMAQASASAEGVKVARGEASSYTVVLSPPGIDRIFLHSPGSNDSFGAADVDLEVVRKARHFHLGYPTLMRGLFLKQGAETAEILRRARDTGVTTSLDISLPDPNSEAGRADWREIYRRALPHTDIFLPSIEETFFTLHPREYLQQKAAAGGAGLVERIPPKRFAALAEELLAMGCKVVALKGGHRGWYLRTASRKKLAELGRAAPRDLDSWADRELWCPAFRIDAIAGATGSGDSSIAGFLTALLRGHGLVECLKLANAAGYMNLRRSDALSGLVPWEELTAALATLTPRENSFLGQESGWRWDGSLQLWEKP